MLKVQKVGQWSNPKAYAVDLRTIYPLSLLGSEQTEMPSTLFAYGQFWSTTQQAMANASTPRALTYDDSGPVKNTSYNGSEITVAIGGDYMITFSIQFIRLSGGGETAADAWIRINGNDVPESATRVITPQSSSNTEAFMTVGLMATLQSGSKLEVVFASPDYQNTVAEYIAASSSPYIRPAIPSIITTLMKVG